jgi:hypothetical protein
MRWGKWGKENERKKKKKTSWNAESSQAKQQNSICTLQLENWPGRRRVLITSVETRETRRRCRRVLEDYSNDVYAHSPRRFASCLVPSPSGFQPRREKRGGRLLRVQLFAGETKNKTKQKKSLALRRCNDAEHRSLMAPTAAHVQPPKRKKKRKKSK